MSALAEWISDDIRRRRERWYRERQAEAFATKLQLVLEKASREGYLDVIQEVYDLGYADAETKKSHRLDGKVSQGNRSV